MQDVVRDFLFGEHAVAGVADADAQSPEIARADRGGNVFETVMACEPSTVLELDDTRLQVEFVVGDQHFRRSDLVEAYERAHCEPASVHERLRNDETRFAFSHESVEFCLCAKALRASFCELLRKPCASIVTRRRVLAPCITQPDDQAQRIGNDLTLQQKGPPAASGRALSEATGNRL